MPIIKRRISCRNVNFCVVRRLHSINFWLGCFRFFSAGWRLSFKLQADGKIVPNDDKTTFRRKRNVSQFTFLNQTRRDFPDESIFQVVSICIFSFASECTGNLHCRIFLFHRTFSTFYGSGN